jgi:hypothetical protein
VQDVVEGALREWERKRITFHQGGVDPGALQMSAGELELLLFDVDPD